MSAVGFPDANYDKVSDENSLFPITAGLELGRDFFFFITKERVIMFKDVNNTPIETFLMEMGAPYNLGEYGVLLFFSQWLKEVGLLFRALITVLKVE